jgi:hypothetical protein
MKSFDQDDETDVPGRRRAPVGSQREVMCAIFAAWKHDHERVIREYVAAEERGEVERKSNKSDYSAERYARALLRDGIRKGWLK